MKTQDGNIRETADGGKTANLSASASNLTKRETIAYMNATVTGIRQTAPGFWPIHADRT